MEENIGSTLFRSSRSQIFFKIRRFFVIFSKFRNIHRKTPALESFFKKVADLKAYNLVKRLHHRCFPVNVEKFLSTAFLYNSSDGCFLLFIVNICYFFTFQINKCVLLIEMMKFSSSRSKIS